MSDIKKIKDEYLNKLDSDLNVEILNQIKTELFGKNGKISNSFKSLSNLFKYSSLIFFISDIFVEYLLTL